MGADKLPAQQGGVKPKPDIDAEVFTVGYKNKRKIERSQPPAGARVYRASEEK